MSDAARRAVRRAVRDPASLVDDNATQRLVGNAHLSRKGDREHSTTRQHARRTIAWWPKVAQRTDGAALAHEGLPAREATARSTFAQGRQQRLHRTDMSHNEFRSQGAGANQHGFSVVHDGKSPPPPMVPLPTVTVLSLTELPESVPELSARVNEA